MLTPEWIPHHRSIDAELVGWIRPVDEGWVADAWLLERRGRDIQVRITEFTQIACRQAEPDSRVESW